MFVCVDSCMVVNFWVVRAAKRTGMFLVIDTSRWSDVYIFVCDVSVTFSRERCKCCLRLAACKVCNIVEMLLHHDGTYVNLGFSVSDQLGEENYFFFVPTFFSVPEKNFLILWYFFFWSSKNIFGSQKKNSWFCDFFFLVWKFFFWCFFGGRLSNKAWGIVWALNSFCPLHRTALKMCLRLLMRA